MTYRRHRLNSLHSGDAPGGRKAVALLLGALVALSMGCVGSGEPRAGQPSLPELAVVVREALGMRECQVA